MRIKYIIIGFAISLMSISCPQKRINIILENKTNKNMILSCTKNVDSLKNIILEKSYLDDRFKFLPHNSIKIDSTLEYWLSYYSGMKNQNYYTFYFLKVVKFDTIKDNYVFEKRYDSINVDKEKILIGDEGKNKIIYTNKKIVFMSSEAD